MQSRRLELMVCLFLIAATIAAYWQVRNHDFVNYDDNRYVTENRRVQAGLSAEGLVWAFTGFHASNWHPLTWLSHMVDCELYGIKPKGHHLTNLLFHIANSLLLFLLLRRVTGALWRSAFAAALFALHPLHVESVAWVAERKDILSALFWILTTWAYVRYVESPGLGRYSSVLLLFALGLMAKPMLVTLPFVLLLMDYWPFRRFQFQESGDDRKSKRNESSNNRYQRFPVHHLVREKVPLLVVSAASSVVTYLAQQSGGAVASLVSFPLEVRVANALVSYVNYIGKMILPYNLALLYPHPQTVPIWKAAGACVFLLSISALAIRAGSRRPYLLVGWLWYLGTLVPVIGLVQVGSQAMADRYTYVPLIGLFIMVAWGMADLVTGLRYRKLVFAASAGGVLAALMIGTYWQVHHWHNSITLFQHSLEVTTGNWLAHNNLGNALAEQENLEKAIGHYSKALRIYPDCAMAHNNLGNALREKGEVNEAISHYTKALRIDSKYAEAHNNLGSALADQGRFEEAIRHCSEALQIKPDNAKIHCALAVGLAGQGRFQEAISHFSRALHLDPDFAEAHQAHNDLGIALNKISRFEQAIRHFSEAVRIKPDFAEAHANLGIGLARKDKLHEAVTHLSEALRIAPDSAGVHYSLGLALALGGRHEKAMHHFSQAVKIDPDFAEAHFNLGAELASQGSLEEAIDHFSEALRVRPSFAEAKQYMKQALEEIQKRNSVSNSISGQ